MAEEQRGPGPEPEVAPRVPPLDEGRYRRLVETLEERHLVYTHDVHGVFDYVSPSIERILGHTPEEFRTHYTRYLTDHPVNEEARRHTDLSIAGEKQPPYEVEIYHRDGSRRWLAVLETPMLAPDGTVVGVQGIARDITEMKRDEERRRETEARYRTLFESAGDAIFVADVDTGQLLDANPCALELVGRTLEEVRGMHQSELHPPDSGASELFARGKRAPGDLLEIDVLHRDGRRTPVEIHGSFIQGAGGRRVVIGVFRDVTARRAAEKLQSALYRIAEETSAARDLNALYRSIHEIVGGLMDARNLFVAIHEPVTDTLTFPYFVDERDPNPGPQPVGRGLTAWVLRTGEPQLVGPERFAELLSRGQVEQLGTDSVDWMGVPLRGHGRVFGVLAVQTYDGRERYTERDREVLTFVSRHISTAIERKRAEETIRHHAFHDYLTGLPNRLLFFDRLEQAMAGALRRKEGVAVMFLDLDGFKPINDLLGHAAGDHLLAEVACRLRGVLREADTVARLGGDEFLLMIPGRVGPESAEKVAAKVLASFETPFPLEEREIRLTASVGIALFPDDGLDADTLVRRADEALYRAKDAGRNRWFFWKEKSADRKTLVPQPR